MEDSCPAIFQPQRQQTEHINGVWLRMYPATDLAAWVSEGQVKIFSALGDPRGIALGSEAAWARGPQPLACGRRHGVFFARLMQPAIP
jgi:hypothetical protein